MARNRKIEHRFYFYACIQTDGDFLCDIDSDDIEIGFESYSTERFYSDEIEGRKDAERILMELRDSMKETAAGKHLSDVESIKLMLENAIDDIKSGRTAEIFYCGGNYDGTEVIFRPIIIF